MAGTVEMRRLGAQSISFYVEQTPDQGGSDIEIGQEFWTTLPAGRLKTLMTSEYVDIEAFLRAVADEGGALTSFGGYDQDPGIAGLDLADDKPVLTVQGTTSYVKPTVVRFSLAYSASE